MISSSGRSADLDDNGQSDDGCCDPKHVGRRSGGYRVICSFALVLLLLIGEGLILVHGNENDDDGAGGEGTSSTFPIPKSSTSLRHSGGRNSESVEMVLSLLDKSDGPVHVDALTSLELLSSKEKIEVVESFKNAIVAAAADFQDVDICFRSCFHNNIYPWYFGKDIHFYHDESLSILKEKKEDEQFVSDHSLFFRISNAPTLSKILL